MGTNTLTNRAAGETILDTFFNTIHQALNGDFVGRNTSGVPTSGQNLGTLSIPWGAVRATSLILNGDAVDTSQITSPVNRIISGAVRTTSNQPAYIKPTGSAASFQILGSAVTLNFDVNGTSCALSSNLTKSSLTVAPSSNNTCLVDDALAADQDDTRLWGETYHRKHITVDNMGSNITALVGKFATFKHGSEYFLAFVESTTKLSKCYRGFFYDSTIAPLNRDVFTNNDTITLMSTGWIFLEDDSATIDVTYTNPVWAQTSPSSPSTGDYWYDMTNQVWKRYDGATFVQIDRTFVGIAVIDATNCVAARSVEYFANHSDACDLMIEVESVTKVRMKKSLNSVVSFGRNLVFGPSNLPTWDITASLATGADMIDATEQASRMYYLYISDYGKLIMSDIHPHRRDDFCGYYHPHNTWRCIGQAYNSSGSDITKASANTKQRSEILVDTGNGHGGTYAKIRRFTNTRTDDGAAAVYADSATLGASLTIFAHGIYTISYGDYATGGQMAFGASLNSSVSDATNTSINLLTFLLGRLGYTYSTGANEGGNFSWTGELKVGDVVRPHTQGDANSTDDGANFRLTKVGDL